MYVCTYGRTDVRTYIRTEFLPILQDFVPCWGRCPKRGTVTLNLSPKKSFLSMLPCFLPRMVFHPFVIQGPPSKSQSEKKCYKYDLVLLSQLFDGKGGMQSPEIYHLLCHSNLSHPCLLNNTSHLSPMGPLPTAQSPSATNNTIKITSCCFADFLVACTRLHKLLCWSVSWCVGPLVGPLVRCC